MLVIRGAYIRGGLIFGGGLHSGFYRISVMISEFNAITTFTIKVKNMAKYKVAQGPRTHKQGIEQLVKTI